MAVDLKNHPGLNPEYFKQMEARQDVMTFNSQQRALALLKKPHLPQLPPPPQPNKYIPHIGAKQRAKAIRLETIKASG